MSELTSEERKDLAQTILQQPEELKLKAFWDTPELREGNLSLAAFPSLDSGEGYISLLIGSDTVWEGYDVYPFTIEDVISYCEAILRE